MERLTVRGKAGKAFTKPPMQSFASPVTTQDAIERLAKYEDTCLTPEEVARQAKEIIPIFDGYKEFLYLRRYLFDFWDKHGMDACHKSYEGAFELLLAFPNYFDDGANKDEPEYFEITLHCYVLGPHRHYHWRGNNFKEVVKEARHDIERWIKDEMEMDNENI